MKNKRTFIYITITILFVLLLILFKEYNIKGQQVPILLYHHFLTEEELKNYNNSDEYAVSVENFEKQMKYLYEQNYKTITLDELYCWKKNKCKIPTKSFVIVMDDGLTSIHKYAKPVLEKYQYQATLFTISSRVDETTKPWDATNYQYIGNDIIKTKDDTIDIQSHSNDLHKKIDGHKAIETLNYQEIYQDLNESKKILNARYLAYPFNTFNQDIFKALEKNNYLLAFRGTNKKTYKGEYEYMISRIFINNDLNRFKTIFETNEYNQTLIDKIKTDLVRIKKMVM